MQQYPNNQQQQQQPYNPNYRPPTAQSPSTYQPPQQPNAQPSQQQGYQRPAPYTAPTNGYTAPNSLNNSFNSMSVNSSPSPAPAPSTYRPQPMSAYSPLPKPTSSTPTPSTYGQPRSYQPPSMSASTQQSPVQPRPLPTAAQSPAPSTASSSRPLTSPAQPYQPPAQQPAGINNGYKPQPLQPMSSPPSSQAPPQPSFNTPSNGYQPRPLPSQQPLQSPSTPAMPQQTPYSAPNASAPPSPNTAQTQSLRSFTSTPQQPAPQQQPPQPAMSSAPPGRIGYTQPAVPQPAQQHQQPPQSAGQPINGMYQQQQQTPPVQQFNSQPGYQPAPQAYNGQQQQPQYGQNGYNNQPAPPQPGYGQQQQQSYQPNDYNAGYDGQAGVPNGYNDQYSNQQQQPQPSYGDYGRRGSQSNKQMIDPSQIPRPEFKTSSAAVKYYTKSGYSPPGACSDYTVIDEGNCSPRFIRMTTHAIGITDEMVQNTKLSIGAVLQPLAELGDAEEPIPVVDYATGPIRCSRCLAYINPGFTFIDGGAKFMCNICLTKNDVPDEYRSNLDANGQRRDKFDRAELCRGSVEFVVGAEFINKPVNDPVFLFVVDVSYAAILTGLVDTAVQSIRSIVDAKATDNKFRMGVITYDSSVQFYSLKPAVSTEPTLFVMADVDDPFVPCPADEVVVYVHNDEARSLLHATLDMIASLYTKAKAVENLPAVGAAVSAAVDTLLSTGGKVLMMQTNLSLVGCGTLTNRDNSQLYFTDKEKTLQLPQNAYYHTVATTAAENSITVDLFVCTNTYVDVATVGVLCEKTGGQIYNYPGFNNKKDGLALARDLYHDATRNTGYDGVMIVRCTAGLRVAELYGNFYHRRPLEMDLPTVDADKSFGVRFEHDGTLKDKSEVCIQSALLYTTSGGERRIRVHTITLQTTSIIGNLFRYSDLDAIINLSLKQVVRQLIDTTTTHEAQQSITQACIDSLYMYRKHCATSTSAGQLILPEPLKLLPLSTIALIKHPLFQDGIPADERSFLFQYVSSMPAYVSVAFVCPRLFGVQSLIDQPQLCVPDANGSVALPSTLSLSSEQITPYDIYLLDDSRFVYIYVAPETPEPLVRDVFDLIPDGRSMQYKLRTNQPPDSISARINVLVETLRRHKPYYQNLQIMVGRRQQVGVQQSTASLDERQFFDHLIEDKVTTPKQTIHKHDTKFVNPNTMSYIDFLVWLHRRIQNKFTME